MGTDEPSGGVSEQTLDAEVAEPQPAPGGEPSTPAEPPAEEDRAGAHAEREAPAAAIEPEALDASAAPCEAPEASAAPRETADTDGTDDFDDEPGGEESAETEAEGAGKKKRRRRRRKKKADGEPAESEAHDAAEEADVAAESAPDDERKRKRPRPSERPAFSVGDEVFGRVEQVTRWAVWIDVAGGKASALFDRDDLIQVPPLPGSQFIAKVKSLSTRGGMLMLGPGEFDTAQSRAELRAALESGNPVTCYVTGVIKGGLEVDYRGVRGFAPASHVDLNPNADLSPMLGEKLPFVVTQYGKKGRDVVLSRKEMIEQVHREKREALLAQLTPDMVCKAVVRNVVSWGAFVTLPEHDDVEGVIHMSEASHDRGARVGEVLTAGEQIDVKILKIDEKGKLWLSRKAAIEDPWERAAERYQAGSIHRGKVVRLTEFGAFIQLEAGIDGLCHVSDLSFEPVDHPSKVVSEGDELDVFIAHVDAKKRKVTLHPAPPENERDRPRAKLVQYQCVSVVVVQIREAGLGVRIVGATGRSARGFIPAGQTGTSRGTDLRKTFPLGSTLEAKIIEIDPRRGEARLSIRAIKDDEEKRAYREYRKQVQREASFGTFGDLLKKNLQR